MEKKEWQKNFEDTIILMMGRIHLRARDVIEELVPMVELELDKAREEGRREGRMEKFKETEHMKLHKKVFYEPRTRIIGEVK